LQDSVILFQYASRYLRWRSGNSCDICLRQIAAGNRRFLAIGDWITSYREQLIDLLKPSKNRLPSYSTVRRALLHIDSEHYSACLGSFFEVQPNFGETIGLDGKVLKGSYQLEDDHPNSDSHPAIMLVSAYIVERGLILELFCC